MADKSAQYDIKGLRHAHSPGIETCNGCAVCTLSCPVWGQTHDLLLTFCGRMRTTQGGASPEDLRASAEACVLCGSCEPICNFSMDTIARTIELRAELNRDKPMLPKRTAPSAPASGPASERILLASQSMLDNEDLLEKVLGALGVTAYEDNGEDISIALETGAPLPEGRIAEFLSALSGAEEVITTDGLIYRLVLSMARSGKVTGMGQALIDHAGIAGRLRKDDIYIIDSRTYHADFERLVLVYDRLRQETGCMMNLDLHRVATPTGAVRTPGPVDPVRQAAWILEGRPATRVVVEMIEDMEPFRKATGIPVVHVSELLGE